jgi:hypothetical protein
LCFGSVLYAEEHTPLHDKKDRVGENPPHDRVHHGWFVSHSIAGEQSGPAGFFAHQVEDPCGSHRIVLRWAAEDQSPVGFDISYDMIRITLRTETNFVADGQILEFGVNFIQIFDPASDQIFQLLIGIETGPALAQLHQPGPHDPSLGV